MNDSTSPRRTNRGLRFGAGVLIALVGCGLVAPRASHAWDTPGHRTITFLALDGFATLTPDRPAFLADGPAREMVSFQASEPDRYRAVRTGAVGGTMKHENDPEHYLDVEDLGTFGLTLDTLPPFRYEYLRAMAIARHEHAEGTDPNADPSIPPYNPKVDFAKTQEFPGYGAHAMTEHHAKLVAAFKTYRILVQLGKPGSTTPAPGNEAQRAAQMKMAEANILAEMGHLSHFVGDHAQPLHTTRHHHGWVGKNPNGYTTDKGIHAYIDGTIVKMHGLRYAVLKDQAAAELAKGGPNARVGTSGSIWPDVIAHIHRGYEKVEPLYVLKKSGDLEKEPGKVFIAERLVDAGTMLAALYADAWKASVPTDDDVKAYLRYDGTDEEPGDAK